MPIASPPRNMPFPVAEIHQRCFDLSLAEHGALRLLYDAYWLNGGPLDDNDATLARITKTINAPRPVAEAVVNGISWTEIRKVVSGFFRVSGGKWHCQWIDASLAAAQSRRSRQQLAAKSTNYERWSLDSKKPANTPQNGGNPSDSLTESLTESDAVELFGSFWAEWPSHERKSNKQKAFRAFCRAIIKDGVSFDNIMAGLKRWKESQQWMKDDGQYIPFPTTWLNRRDWEVFTEKSARHGAPGQASGPTLNMQGQVYTLQRGPTRSEYPSDGAFDAASKRWLLWKTRH
jgi:uncharacterized protein YdaU (DUF1376 family)